MEPLKINAVLQVDGHYPVKFTACTWLEFLIRINEFMDKNNWISFPVGEDDATKMVTKTAKEVDKFS